MTSTYDAAAMAIADKAQACTCGYDLQQLIFDECHRHFSAKRSLHDEWQERKADFRARIAEAEASLKALREEFAEAKEDYAFSMSAAKQAHCKAVRMMEDAFKKFRDKHPDIVGRNDFNAAVHTIRKYLMQADRDDISVQWGKASQITIKFETKEEEVEPANALTDGNE